MEGGWGQRWNWGEHCWRQRGGLPGRGAFLMKVFRTGIATIKSGLTLSWFIRVLNCS